MYRIYVGKSSELVQCAITGPCLRRRHRPSAYRTVLIRKICRRRRQQRNLVNCSTCPYKPCTSHTPSEKDAVTFNVLTVYQLLLLGNSIALSKMFNSNLAMARCIVSYRISRYWGRDNYPSNEVDIPHNSQSETSTKGVLCSVAGAGKVTLIGSNCPASRVGPCVDCKGGRTAQIFSDCAITKYLSHATARQPCGRPTIAAVESPQLLLFGGQYWTSRNTGRPPTVASPVSQYPLSRHLQQRQCW